MSPSSQKSPAGVQNPTCPSCGYDDTYGLDTCPRCRTHLFKDPQYEGAKQRYWLTVVLFGVLALFLSYPYLKRSIPALERLVEPGAADRRKGNQHFRNGQWKRAYQAFDSALKKRSKLSRVMSRTERRNRTFMHYKMAIASLQLRDDKKAIYHGIQAHKISPSWFPPFEILLHLYARLGQKKPFLALAKRAEKRFAKWWRVWLVLGNCYMQVGMEKKAFAAFKQGIYQAPHRTQMLNSYALAIAQSKKPSKADLKKAYAMAQKAAKKMGKHSFSSRDTLAQIIYRQGDKNKAIALQKEAIAKAQRLQQKMKAAGRAGVRMVVLRRSIREMRRRLAKMQAPTPQPKTRPKARTKAPAPKASAKTAKTAPTSRPAAPPSRPAAPTSRPAPRPEPLPLRPAPPLPRQIHHRRSRRLLLPK